MKYEVEYACFRKVIFDADSEEEANNKSATMDDEEIERNPISEGYMIWNGPYMIGFSP